jgi:hypothetical protein
MMTATKAKRPYTRKAPKDYSAKTMYSRLRSLVNMRKHWFTYPTSTIYTPEPKLMYALERVDGWLDYAKNFTEVNFYSKIQKEKADIIMILPSSTGKQKTVRENILDDLEFTKQYAV